MFLSTILFSQDVRRQNYVSFREGHWPPFTFRFDMCNQPSLEQLVFFPPLWSWQDSPLIAGLQQDVKVQGADSLVWKVCIAFSVAYRVPLS